MAELAVHATQLMARTVAGQVRPKWRSGRCRCSGPLHKWSPLNNARKKTSRFRARVVGRVERSETHRCLQLLWWVSLRSTHPKTFAQDRSGSYFSSVLNNAESR
ncbi:MAG: hypothetical protein EXR98_13230 [Gemmataceae bacterium]|nr:hypothetical protein [Gemmataceae bacterium]